MKKNTDRKRSELRRLQKKKTEKHKRVGERDSVDVELVTEMEEKASRLASETASGSEGEVGGNQQIVYVFRVNFASDGCVVAGRARVLHYGSGVGGEPEEAEDCSVHVWGLGAQIV